MDMYQKRNIRKKNKIENNNNSENTNKTNINWYIGTYAKTHSNLYKINVFKN